MSLTNNLSFSTLIVADRQHVEGSGDMEGKMELDTGENFSGASLSSHPDASGDGLNEQRQKKIDMKYEQIFNDYCEWLVTRNYTMDDEGTLQFLIRNKTKYKGTSLFVAFCGIINKLKSHFDIDGNEFEKCKRWLKNYSKQFINNNIDRDRVRVVLNRDNFLFFIRRAGKDKYWNHIICLILGVLGGVRIREYSRLKWADVTEKKNKKGETILEFNVISGKYNCNIPFIIVDAEIVGIILQYKHLTRDLHGGSGSIIWMHEQDLNGRIRFLNKLPSLSFFSSFYKDVLRFLKLPAEGSSSHTCRASGVAMFGPKVYGQWNYYTGDP